MAGVNKVIILGRLGQDPELRMTSNNQAVCSFSLATSESWMKDGKKEEKTEWHKIVIWGRQAEIAAKYLAKGKNVYLEGRLQTRSWEDKEGQKRYTTEIVANHFVFVDAAGGRRDADNEEYGASAGSNNNNSGFTGGGYETPSASTNASFDEDVPF